MNKQTLLTVLTLTTVFVLNSSAAVAALPAQHSQQPEGLLVDHPRPLVAAEVVQPALIDITQSLKAQRIHLDSAFAEISNENIRDVYVFLGGTGHGKSTLINILAEQPLEIARRRHLVRLSGVNSSFDHILPGASQLSVTDKCNVALHDHVLYVDSPGFMDIPADSQRLSTLSKYFSTAYLFEKLRARNLHPKIILCVKGDVSSFDRTVRGGVYDALSCLKMFGNNVPWESVQLAWTQSDERFTRNLVEAAVQGYYEGEDIATFEPISFEYNAAKLLNNGHIIPSIDNTKFARDFNSDIRSFFAESVTAFHTKMGEVNPWNEPRFILGRALEPGHVAGVESVINSDATKIIEIARELLAPITGTELEVAEKRSTVFEKFTDLVMGDSDAMIKLITEERLLTADQLKNLKGRFSSVMALKVFATENANDPINAAILKVTKGMKHEIEVIQEKLKKDLETKKANQRATEAERQTQAAKDELARKEQEILKEKQRSEEAQRQRPVYRPSGELVKAWRAIYDATLAFVDAPSDASRDELQAEMRSAWSNYLNVLRIVRGHGTDDYARHFVGNDFPNSVNHMTITFLKGLHGGCDQ